MPPKHSSECQIGLGLRPRLICLAFFSANYFQIGQHLVLLHVLKSECTYYVDVDPSLDVITFRSEKVFMSVLLALTIVTDAVVVKTVDILQII